jgi:hypothetical protein
VRPGRRASRRRAGRDGAGADGRVAGPRSRFGHRGAVLAGVTLLAACGAGRSDGAALAPQAAGGRFPRDAARFELRPVADTALRLAVAEVRWIRAGLEGIAVDPARGDALVARFRVVRVAADSATGLVTGQTTRLSAQHVALLVPPTRPWWRVRLFWLGAAGGGILGAALGALAGR